VQFYSAFCLIVSCIVGAILGGRLLWLWSRSRKLPELCIWVTSLTLSLSGALLLGVAGVPSGERGPLLFSLMMTSMLLLAVSSISLAVGFWRIFRPQERWPGWLCALASLALLVWWLFSLYEGGSGLTGEIGLRSALHYSGRLLIHVWGTWECFRYYAMLKRRASLDLADPVIAHRFWLWGISSAGMVAMVAVPCLSSYLLRASVMAWPAGVLALATLGLFSSLTIWCAFFPPAFYRRMLQAHISQGAT